MLHDQDNSAGLYKVEFARGLAEQLRLHLVARAVDAAADSAYGTLPRCQYAADAGTEILNGQRRACPRLSHLHTTEYTMNSPLLLPAAALSNVAIALLHVYVIAKGAEAYRFFGAGETLARMAESGSPLPALLTSAITLTFLAFAVYYMAAAGWLPRPPLFRIAIITIAAIYLLRGALIFPAWLFGMQTSTFDTVSSLLSLALGGLHAAGAMQVLRETPQLAAP